MLLSLFFRIEFEISNGDRKTRWFTRKERIAKLHEYIIEFQNACTVPARISTPTIGILNGINYGLAIDLASAYSIRVGVEGARFSIAEVNIGIAADMGSLQKNARYCQ